jgi:DNA helicase II / ATP-dependent DNA helicase PcrA
MTTRNWTPRQREAIETEHARVLLAAGPGSGKTATIAARVDRLIGTFRANSKEIAVVTYTNAAAREIEERMFDPRVQDKPYPLGFCGTLHGFCLRLLRDYGEEFGYGRRMTIVSPESAADLLASKATTIGCKTPLKDLLALKAKGHPGRGLRLDLAKTVVATYFDELKENGVVDFDVILSEALHLLVSVPVLPYSYLFVDEAQDSSSLDWSIYRALPILNKFIVGDPDQAIYGFRGGAVSEFLAFSRDPYVKVIPLEENFRSRPEICAAANQLIFHNKTRIAKTTVSTREAGGILVSLTSKNEGEEIAAIARDIGLRGYDPGKIAVLTRTNDAASAFRKPFEAWGLSVKGRETSDLPRDWPLARAFVELLVDPDNDTLAELFTIARAVDKGALRSDARRQAHALRKIANSLGQTIASYVEFRGEIFRQPKCLDEVTQAAQFAGVSLESRALIAERLKELPSGSSFLDLALALAPMRKAVEEEEADGIELLTIHSAKGREFDVVYLAAFEDEVLPGRRPGVDVEEERRLAYVAITRAREVVVFSTAYSRASAWGSVDPRTPSRFLDEAWGLPPSSWKPVDDELEARKRRTAPEGAQG